MFGEILCKGWGDKILKPIFISDVIHGNIELSNLEKKIISTSLFNRLHYISQNSTAYLTFPTNRTKRFEHCVGTMHLAGNMFKYSISNASEEDLQALFKEFDKVLDDVIGEDVNADRIKNIDVYRKMGRLLYPCKNQNGIEHKIQIFGTDTRSESIEFFKNFDIKDHLYEVNIPRNVSKEDEASYFLMYQSVRIAGLLHDLGHPPMSHIVENTLEKLIKFIDEKNSQEKPKGKPNKRQSTFLKCVDKYRASGVALHEKIGNDLTENLFSIIFEQSFDGNGKLYNFVFESLLFCFVTRILNSSIYDKSTLFYDLHSIVDGTLDCDRLDYVARDPLNSGFKVGQIEYDRLFASMKLIHVNGAFYFAPHTKTLGTINDFFERRWNMYEKIIFHHRVVKTDYLLSSCVRQISEKYLSCDKDDHKNPYTDELTQDISGLWRAIQKTTSEEEGHNNIIQWTDDWLSTVLKSYYLKQNIDRNSILYCQLDEIISNKKHYYSLIKKSSEANILNDSIGTKVLESTESITGLMLDLEKLSKQSTKLNIHDTLDYIKGFLNLCKYNTDEDDSLLTNIPVKALIHPLNFFRFTVTMNFVPKKDFDNIIYKAVNKVKDQEPGVEDVICMIKEIKTGIGKELLLYSEDANGKYQHTDFSKNSFIEKLFHIKQNTFTTLFCYVKRKDDKVLDFKNLIKKIGGNIGDEIIILIKKKLKGLKDSILKEIESKEGGSK